MYDTFNGEDVYKVFNNNIPWFDGYSGQLLILLDDYGHPGMDINLLKQLLDRYPMRLPVKCGSVVHYAAIIVITTNQEPRDWYPIVGTRDYDAIMRRLTVFDFDTDAGRTGGLDWLHHNRRVHGAEDGDRSSAGSMARSGGPPSRATSQAPTVRDGPDSDVMLLHQVQGSDYDDGEGDCVDLTMSQDSNEHNVRHER